MKVSIRERKLTDSSKVPRWVCFNPDNDYIYLVFGLPQGGETKEEAVFWAQRIADKNGLTFERPEGFEDVVGALPTED